MTEREAINDELETFFSAAREKAPKASDALMARVLEDADRLARPAATSRPRFWTRLADALGGWQGIGGLATAAAAGLWIGYAGIADPATLSGGMVALETSEIVELMPGAEVFALLAEGEG